MDGVTLWHRRFREWLREFLRYGRFIFNDHLMVILILTIGAGTYYYQDFLQLLPQEFPGRLFFALLYGWLLITGQVTTFLKAPDTVFLLPAESRLRPYFLRAFLYTYVTQAFITVLISLLLAPLYLETVRGPGFLLFLFLSLLLKLINLWIRWQMYYESDATFARFDRILCFALNAVALYLFLDGALFFSAVVLVLQISYGLYFFGRNKERTVPWELLISLEEQRLMRFYRFANLFTDVPHLRSQVKRRKVFDRLLERIPFQRDRAEFYLYTRTFLRGGDYFGLFVRLSLIGGIIVWGVKGTVAGILLGALMIYLTGFQLLGLWKHHDGVIWSRIYPFEPTLKRKALSRLLTVVLSLQDLWFTILFLLARDWLLGLIFFLVNASVIYLFVNIYAWKRLNG